ncbi:hypothetical protein G7046_g3328 [Stylonectria norvegica]|nr:hypothetical protein G7046_g3328 [Stylonectria norvegica]
MEESAPKRRRTSPRTSVNNESPPTETLEASRPRRKRPSFASPTKASLARHNPGVLERRASTSPSKPSSAAPRRRLSDATSEQSLSDLLTTQLDSTAGSALASETGNGDDGQDQEERRETAVPSFGTPTRHARGGMASRARRSATKPNPRPLPPPGPSVEEEFNPFAGRTLARSPLGGSQTAARARASTQSGPQSQPEARSPPKPQWQPRSQPQTATQPQPEPQSLSESEPLIEPPSPLEPEPEVEAESDVEIEVEPESEVEPEVDSEVEAEEELEVEPGPEANSEPEPEAEPEAESEPEFESESEPEPEAEAEPEPEPELPPTISDLISSTPPKGIHTSPSRWRDKTMTKNKKPSPLRQPPMRPSRKSMPGVSSFRDQLFGAKNSQITPPVDDEPAIVARKTRSYDRDAKKKELREALRQEIETLKTDLATAQEENGRIRLMQQSGRVLAPSNQDGVLDLIRRHDVPSDTQFGSAAQQLTKALLNPSSLLPFGKALQPASFGGGDEVDVSNIKSHHPVLMAAEEELPYLELFSPFSIFSNIAMLPSEPQQPPRQRHSITLRSREIPGLFTARINIIVNALNLTILDLNVMALEPSAKAELGSFVHKLCAGDCNRTMERNVGILTWAMGEWLRVALERAVFWTHLERAVGSEDALLRTTSEMRARKSKRRKDNEDDSQNNTEKDEAPLKRADFLRFMGQQHFDILLPGDSRSSLRLEWKTGFDWTGGAQSKLAVTIGVPGKWHQLDERGSLAKLPQLFEDLVDGGEEPANAVRTLIALIAGDTA